MQDGHRRKDNKTLSLEIVTSNTSKEILSKVNLIFASNIQYVYSLFIPHKASKTALPFSERQTEIIRQNFIFLILNLRCHHQALLSSSRVVPRYRYKPQKSAEHVSQGGSPNDDNSNHAWEECNKDG